MVKSGVQIVYVYGWTIYSPVEHRRQIASHKVEIHLFFFSMLHFGSHML